MTDQSKIMSK